jgi:hypothetical protein
VFGIGMLFSELMGILRPYHTKNYH